VTGAFDRAGIDLVRYPITDMGVPQSGEPFRALLRQVRESVAEGQSVVVACRGGLGRTGTVVASVLRESGLDGDEAIAQTRAARKGTIENADQEAFVRDWQPANG
jgi:protein-tyrosine phosphatase